VIRLTPRKERLDMVRRRTAQTSVEKCLGKKVARALFTRAERMAKKGATVARIEKAIAAELMKQMKTKVVRRIVYRASGAAGLYRHRVYAVPRGGGPGRGAKGTK
jgi:hypothetical protein